MFDLHGAERVACWKKFRDSLEVSDRPLDDVAIFWSKAPFVSRYLNPYAPEEWPDPWRLILDAKLDDLAIALCMLYTLKLTHRFMGSDYEIHMSMHPEKNKEKYILLVNGEHVLNMHWGGVANIDEVDISKTTLLWKK